MAFEEVLVRDALDLGFILIRTIILPILLCLLIRFDTLICDCDHQYEFIIYFFIRLLIFDDSICATLTLASSFVHLEFGRVDEVYSVSTTSIFAS